MLTKRELATLLAALRYWREEMSPHGRAIMAPYFRQLRLDRVRPLHIGEIDILQRKLHTQFQASCSSRRRAP